MRVDGGMAIYIDGHGWRCHFSRFKVKTSIALVVLDNYCRLDVSAIFLFRFLVCLYLAFL